jgi:hypothetical protein
MSSDKWMLIFDALGVISKDPIIRVIVAVILFGIVLERCVLNV